MPVAPVAPQLASLLQRHPGLLKLGLAVLLLAWLLTKTSASLLGNVPLAILSVVSVRWALAQLDRKQRAKLLAAKEAPPRAWRHEAPPCSPAPTFGVAPGAAKPDSWRKFVRAPVVEDAWARFCGSIVQEWIYETWYTSLTPDREFPAEVRRMLNTAFGQLALRARQLDLRVVLNDLCELCMEQMELYRDTRESILLATQQPHCLRDMSAAARDRAFHREMKAEKNLHPALQTPDGHYKFLKAVSEGVVAYVLDLSDLQRVPARVVSRELLSSCVFRPLMMYCTPYYANKALYALLKDQVQRQAIGQKEAEELSAAMATSRSEAMRGHWEFEQRLLNSEEAEDTALTAARQLRHHLRSKLLQHGRSRSADLAPAKPALPPDERQAQLQQQHSRSRSLSPVDKLSRVAAGSSASAAGSLPAAVGSANSGGGSGSRGGSASLGSQALPPRPPPMQEQEARSPFDVYNVASAVAAVLMPGIAGGAAPGAHLPPLLQQRQEGGGQQTPRLSAGSGWRLAAAGLQPSPLRQQADAAEASLAVGGDGWEAVEPSEPSLTRPRSCDFSAGHLLAPVADREAVAGVTPRAATSSTGSGAYARAGFAGRARAKVVAADLNTSGSKEYVEFKIRVADDDDEWTVSRRYRNFEVLHRQMRQYPSYMLKLPPKRIFIHSNSVEFVEERREALDKYLRGLLTHEQLRHCADLYEFLRAGSQLYELSSPQQYPHPLPPRPGRQEVSDNDLRRRKGLGGLGKAVLESTQSMGRGLSTASGAVAGSVKQGVAEMASAASEGVALVTGGIAGAAGAVVGALGGPSGANHAPREPHPGLTRRVRSVPSGLDRLSSSSSGTGEVAAAGRVLREHSGTALPRGKSSGLLSRAGNRLRTAMSREPSAQQLAAAAAAEHSGSSSGGSEYFKETTAEQQAQQPTLRQQQQLPLQQPSSIGLAYGLPPLSTSPGKTSKLFSSLTRRTSKSRSTSPQKQRERSPARKQRRGTDGSAAGASRRSSADLGPPPSPGSSSGPGGGGGEALPPHVVSSLGAASPQAPSPIFSFPVEPSLDMDDCAGISAPLYEMVDCLFQLQTRGFFRRQVFAVARQSLSLVAGEAIDNYLTSQLRLLRQQHTIGRIIQKIQASLWPGGLWFQRTPAALAAAAQQQMAASHSSAASADSATSGSERRAGMDPERFLEPGGPPPLDEDEIREAVEQLMLRRAPAALVRVIGKIAYASGMQDLFDMAQSPTYMSQLGYGVLEIAVVHLFPELKSLFRTLQHGGLV